MTAPLVVLGAGGRLGRLLAPEWPQGVAQYSRADIDILDTRRLTLALRGARAVLCLAGITPPSRQPMSLNKTLARLTLDAAQAAQSGPVLLMSSAAVYGRAQGALTEDTPPAPLSEYGHAKVEMEEMARAHPHPCTVLRLGNVAGADAILGNWQPGFALDCLPDGSTPRRSYIGPQTLAHVLTTLAASTDLPPVLNVAAPGDVAMGDLLDAAQLDWTPRAPGGDFVGKVTLDTERLSQLCSFDPVASTADGMVREWKAITHRT